MGSKFKVQKFKFKGLEAQARGIGLNACGVKRCTKVSESGEMNKGNV